MAHRPTGIHQQLGGKVGPRVATIISKAMSEHLLRTAGTRAKLSAEGANEFFRGMSREKRLHTASLLALMLGQEGVPPELEKVLEFIAYGQGELSEVIGALGLGGAIATPMGAAIANWLAPFNHKALSEAPNTLIDPGTAARAEAMGIKEGPGWVGEAAGNGVSAQRFAALVRLNEQWPGVGELLELWRRGIVGEGDVREALQRNATATGWAQHLMQLKREHLSPADAALAVLRGIIDEDAGIEIAAISGLDTEDFRTLIGNTGEPPGLMQLLEGYRRGFIDDARLQRGIRQSRVRNEWIDLVEKLRFAPASTADAVNGVVQNHLTPAQGKSIAEQNGLEGADFGWMVENAGNSLANGEILQLWNRGEVSQATVEQNIREGRTKDKYIPHVLQLRWKIPPVRELAKAIQDGSMSQTRGSELLHKEGYEPDVVQALVASAATSQVAKTHSLAQSQIEALYEDHGIDENTALEMLAILGLHSANAHLVLRLVDLKRERKLQLAATAPIRSAYVARHISETEASGLLDKLKLTGEQRDFYLSLWAIERASTKKVLTEAQTIKANELGIIDDENCEQRLVGKGYTLEDARILMTLEKKRTHPAP